MVENEMYSPQGYLEKVTGNIYLIRGDNDATEIQRILKSLGLELWDYPLNEIDHIVQNGINAVLVECMVWDDKDYEYRKEYRWFEIPDKEQ